MATGDEDQARGRGRNTTTGTTPLNLAVAPIPTGSDHVGFAVYHVIGYRTDVVGTSYFLEQGIAQVGSNGGSVVCGGPVPAATDDAASAAYSIDVFASSGFIVLQVTGASGHTVQWVGSLFLDFVEVPIADE